jgi:small-conductance mechanosensitive channel
LGISKTSNERIRQLEDHVLQLTRQLREERVRSVIDLRLGSGLITEKERSEAEAAMTKLSDEALGLIRQDLVKVLARINAADTPATSTSARSAAYA